MKTALLIACLAMSAAASAQAADWEYLSMQGVQTLCIRADEQHPRVLAGTVEGFHYLDQPSGVWTNRDWGGWIGRQVYAVLGHSDHDTWVITGRENAFWKGYLEVSEDLGATETFAYTGQGGAIVDLEQKGSGFSHRIYACGIPDIATGEFLVSTDGGYHWTVRPSCPHYWMSGIAVDFGGEVYVGGDSRVWATTNDGQTWRDARGDLPALQVECLAAGRPGDAVPESWIYAGNTMGLYVTFDRGLHWDPLLAGGIHKVASYPGPEGGGIVAVITGAGRIQLSLNGGGHWTDETGDLVGLPVDLSFSNYDQHLYVATQNQGVWRTPISLTPIADAPAAAARRLAAWPNPFNPATRLSFRLDAAGPARLTVHDPSGRRIALLHDGPLAAGEHVFDWDAAGLPSGIYLARLRAGAGAATARLVLQK